MLFARSFMKGLTLFSVVTAAFSATSSASEAPRRRAPTQQDLINYSLKTTKSLKKAEKNDPCSASSRASSESLSTSSGLSDLVSPISTDSSQSIANSVVEARLAYRKHLQQLEEVDQAVKLANQINYFTAAAAASFPAAAPTNAANPSIEANNINATASYSINGLIAKKPVSYETYLFRSLLRQKIKEYDSTTACPK